MINGIFALNSYDSYNVWNTSLVAKKNNVLFFDFNSASAKSENYVSEAAPPRKAYGRYPKNSNDQYAKQFANYTAKQCEDYIRTHAKFKNNSVKNSGIAGMQLDSKKALCAILAFNKANGVVVTVNSASRDYNTQLSWFSGPNKKSTATSPDKSHHVLGDGFDLSFSKSWAYEKTGNYAEDVLNMRYGGHCPVHTERWHFDYGNNKRDLYEL